MSRVLIVISVATVVGIAGCGSNSSTGSAAFVKTSFESSMASSVALDGKPVSVAGVTFVPPSAWTDLGPSGMRNASYTFGPIDGEKDSATLTVFYFGQNSGGGVMDNIQRWIGQMKSPDGTDPNSLAIKQEITVDSMPAHIVELPGTFSAGSMMGGPSAPIDNYRMTAVVLEAPGGNVFFKLTGPLKSAQKMSQAFAAVLLNAKRSEASM